ncbi:MAG: nitroreductase family protein [Oscillospiraceae bacterium]
MEFLQALKNRRSVYGFAPGKALSNTEVEALIKDVIKHVPSAFNSQSTRALVLFDDAHRRFWDLVTAAIAKVTDAAAFEASRQKIEGAFKSGFFTVLFFEDESVVDGLVSGFPLYAKNFPVWSQHTNAMSQLAVWTALAEAGIGASLQHYTELVEQDVRAAWNIPASWKLIAQMPAGIPAAPAGEKEFSDISARVLTAET